MKITILFLFAAFAVALGQEDGSYWIPTQQPHPNGYNSANGAVAQPRVQYPQSNQYSAQLPPSQYSAHPPPSQILPSPPAFQILPSQGFSQFLPLQNLFLRVDLDCVSAAQPTQPAPTTQPTAAAQPTEQFHHRDDINYDLSQEVL